MLLFSNLKIVLEIKKFHVFQLNFMYYYRIKLNIPAKPNAKKILNIDHISCIIYVYLTTGFSLSLETNLISEDRNIAGGENFWV